MEVGKGPRVVMVIFLAARVVKYLPFGILEGILDEELNVWGYLKE